jgi:hypothetical protein
MSFLIARQSHAVEQGEERRYLHACPESISRTQRPVDEAADLEMDAIYNNNSAVLRVDIGDSHGGSDISPVPQTLPPSHDRDRPMTLSSFNSTLGVSVYSPISPVSSHAARFYEQYMHGTVADVGSLELHSPCPSPEQVVPLPTPKQFPLSTLSNGNASSGGCSVSLSQSPVNSQSVNDYLFFDDNDINADINEDEIDEGPQQYTGDERKVGPSSSAENILKNVMKVFTVAEFLANVQNNAGAVANLDASGVTRSTTNPQLTDIHGDTGPSPQKLRPHCLGDLSPSWVPTTEAYTSPLMNLLKSNTYPANRTTILSSETGQESAVSLPILSLEYATYNPFDNPSSCTLDAVGPTTAEQSCEAIELGDHCIPDVLNSGDEVYSSAECPEDATTSLSTSSSDGEDATGLRTTGLYLAAHDGIHRYQTHTQTSRTKVAAPVELQSGQRSGSGASKPDRRDVDQPLSTKKYLSSKVFNKDCVPSVNGKKSNTSNIFFASDVPVVRRKLATQTHHYNEFDSGHLTEDDEFMVEYIMQERTAAEKAAFDRNTSSSSSYIDESNSSEKLDIQPAVKYALPVVAPLHNVESETENMYIPRQDSFLIQLGAQVQTESYLDSPPNCQVSIDAPDTRRRSAVPSALASIATNLGRSRRYSMPACTRSGASATSQMSERLATVSNAGSETELSNPVYDDPYGSVSPSEMPLADEESVPVVDHPVTYRQNHVYGLVEPGPALPGADEGCPHGLTSESCTPNKPLASWISAETNRVIPHPHQLSASEQVAELLLLVSPYFRVDELCVSSPVCLVVQNAVRSFRVVY